MHSQWKINPSVFLLLSYLFQPVISHKIESLQSITHNTLLTETALCWYITNHNFSRTKHTSSIHHIHKKVIYLIAFRVKAESIHILWFLTTVLKTTRTRKNWNTGHSWNFSLLKKQNKTEGTFWQTILAQFLSIWFINNTKEQVYGKVLYLFIT